MYVIFSRKNTLIKKLDDVSLQVQKQFFYKLRIISNIKTNTLKGAITIEATISLAVFMIVVLFLASYITVIDKHISTQMKMDNLSRKASKAMFYVEQMDKVSDYSERIKVYKKQYKDEIEEITNGILNFSFVKDGYVDIVNTYNYKMPIWNKNIIITQRMKVKDWTGVDISKSKEEVYITKYGKVYHITKECTHLILHISKIAYGKVDEARNASGGSYSQCEFCGNKKMQNDFYVFITEDGNRYHTELKCSGITRNIIEIDISEVGDRAPCSGCVEDNEY